MNHRSDFSYLRNAYFLLLIFFIFFVNLSNENGNVFYTNINTNNNNQKRRNFQPLTISEARSRSQDVYNIRYNLVLYMGVEKTFKGQAEITFFLKNFVPNLFLDFSGYSISLLRINNENAPYEKLFSNGRIKIPQQFQNIGENKILVQFLCNYSSDGTGLHKYIELETSKIYHFTHFEPYSANRVI